MHDVFCPVFGLFFGVPASEFGVRSVEELRSEGSFSGGGVPEAALAEVAGEDVRPPVWVVSLEPGEAPYADVAGQDCNFAAAVRFEKFLDAGFYVLVGYGFLL